MAFPEGVASHRGGLSKGVPLYMNRHCEEPGCSFQTLKERSPIGYNTAILNVITSTFKQYEQSQPLCIISELWVWRCIRWKWKWKRKISHRSRVGEIGSVADGEVHNEAGNGQQTDDSDDHERVVSQHPRVAVTRENQPLLDWPIQWLKHPETTSD